jgi:hypothetical protein
MLDEQEQNVPPDETPADRFVAEAVERMEMGSWRRVKELLEVDDVQGAD